MYFCVLWVNMSIFYTFRFKSKIVDLYLDDDIDWHLNWKELKNSWNYNKLLKYSFLCFDFSVYVVNKKKISKMRLLFWISILCFSTHSTAGLYLEIPRDVRRIGFDGMVWAVSRARIGVFMTVTVAWANDVIATKLIMSDVKI